MNGKRPATAYYCPADGRLLEYVGFYRCTGCGGHVELGQMVTAEAAARIRAEHAGEVTADGALF